MIELYTAPPPNGHMACCRPEALKLEYNNHFINISEGKLRTPEFRAINPKGRIPAIIDRDIDDLALLEFHAVDFVGLAKMFRVARAAGRV